MSPGTYVIVTAAHDERANIAATIESVVAQTRRPARWIIVSDGSTDGTDDLVRTYAQAHAFIELVVADRSGGHSFGGKAKALELGIRALEGCEREFFGVLDADVRIEADYFEKLIARFAADPQLGVAGGSIVQMVDGKLYERLKDANSVAGAVQFFREGCFRDTGGFPVLEYGGEDAAVEIAARMHGWKVETFPDLRVVHEGWVGDAAGSRLGARFKWGKMNFTLGYHPAFEIARCVFRSVEPPYFVGSVAELAGFVAAHLSGEARGLPSRTIAYLRREQLERLGALFRGNARASKNETRSIESCSMSRISPALPSPSDEPPRVETDAKPTQVASEDRSKEW